MSNGIYQAVDAVTSSDLDAQDMIGVVHDLKPKVLARAKRVVTRTHGDHPLDELLDILGLTEVTA